MFIMQKTFLIFSFASLFLLLLSRGDVKKIHLAYPVLVLTLSPLSAATSIAAYTVPSDGVCLVTITEKKTFFLNDVQNLTAVP